MSTADLYAEMFDEGGAHVRVQRDGDELTVRARILRAGAEELIGGLDQTIRQILVLAADVTFDEPLRRGDTVITASGDLLTIELCDVDSHRERDLLLAYLLTVQG